MGKARQTKRNVNSYTIRGTEEIVTAGDHVLLKSPVSGAPPFVAFVKKVVSNKVEVIWYYRPEDTSNGREHYHGSKELFMSNHHDTQYVNCIIGKCIVHNFKDYININNGNRGPRDYCTRYNYDAIITKELTLDVDRIDRFCICGKCELPYNPDKFIVQCYHCKLRFHPACENTPVRHGWNLCFHCCYKCHLERAGKNSPGQEQATEEQATEKQIKEDCHRARKKMKMSL